MGGKSRICEICGVRERHRPGFFAKFPIDEQRCRTWVRIVGKEDLVHIPIEKLHQVRYICGDHFQARDFNKKGTRLKKRAYPKLQLSAQPLSDHQLKDFPQHVASKASSVTDSTATTATASSSKIPNAAATTLKIMAPDPTSMTKKQVPALDAASTTPQTIMVESSWKNIPTGTSTSTPTAKSKKRKLDDTELTPRKKKLVESLRKTRCTLKSLKKSATAIESIESPVLKEIVLNASKNQSRKSTGRRWTTKHKISCLAILKRSAKTYRYLEHIIPLPSVKTLQNVLKKIPMEPGLNKSVLDHLLKIGEKRNDKQKVCALLFDEVALKPRLLYNSCTGSIEGFQDFGSTKGTSNGRSSGIADHALVFMLQGIHHKFKQPIAFYFVKGTVSSDKLTALVKEIITAVSATGYKVIATVCDQGPTNMGAIKQLKKFSVPSSTSENSFFLDGEEIFVVYDIPHLFKSLRNNFLKNGIMSWNGKKAKWSHLKLVEEKNRNFLYFSKISLVHVEPKYRAKMRVKYAAQILSNTVSAVLKLLSQADKDEEQAAELLETAEVIQELDRLFDFTNGPSCPEDVKRGLRQNVSKKTTHLEEWMTLEKKIKSIKFLNVYGTVATNVKCINGYLTSLKSLRGIWLKTREMGFKYLNLRQLNQDALENLFGVIRQHSPTNSNPTCAHFMAALKTAVVTGLTAPHSAGSNCQKDNSSLLTDFHNLVFGTNESSSQASDNPASSENRPPSDDVKIDADLDDDQNIPLLSLPEDPQATLIENENDLSTTDNQSVVYVSGYLASQIAKANKCNECRNTLTVSPDLVDIKTDDTYAYIRLREWWDDKQSLTYPSKKLCLLVKNATEIMESDICPSLHRNDAFLFALTLFNTGCDTTWFSCALHKSLVLDNIFSTMAHLFLRRQCQRINRGLALREEALSAANKIAQQQGKAK